MEGKERTQEHRGDRGADEQKEGLLPHKEKSVRESER